LALAWGASGVRWPAPGKPPLLSFIPACLSLSPMHRVVIERDEATAIVQAAGELDAFAAPDLAQAFDQVRNEPRVVADFDRVAFMDSTVLGLIVRMARETAEAGGAVRIVLPSGSARRIFEITALDRALPIAETRSTALAELGRSG